MSDVFVVSAVRTPVGIGKPGGALSPMAPVDLTTLVIQEAVRRANIDPGRVEDVIWGCVTPVGDQGANLARLAVLASGLPVQVPSPSTACAARASKPCILALRPSWQAIWISSSWAGLR